MADYEEFKRSVAEQHARSAEERQLLEIQNAALQRKVAELEQQLPGLGRVNWEEVVKHLGKIVPQPKDWEPQIQTLAVLISRGLSEAQRTTNHSKKVFPTRDIFREIENLPSALKVYQRWFKEEEVPEDVAIRKLQFLLPEILLTTLTRMSENEVRTKLNGWSKTVEYLTRTAGGVIGEARLQLLLGEITIEKGDNLLNKLELVENLVSLNPNRLDRSAQSIREKAWAEIERRIPEAVRLDVKTPADGEAWDDLRKVAELQRAFDKFHSQPGRANTIAAVNAERLFELRHLGCKVNFVIDTGATVSVVGQNSPLGRKLESTGATTPTDKIFASPLQGTAGAAWVAKIELEVLYQAGKSEVTRSARLPVEIFGVKGATDPTLYVGGPELTEWGITIDAKTQRFGVSKLRDTEGTPWFSLPQARRDANTPTPFHGNGQKRHPEMQQKGPQNHHWFRPHGKNGGYKGNNRGGPVKPPEGTRQQSEAPKPQVVRNVPQKRRSFGAEETKKRTKR